MPQEVRRFLLSRNDELAATGKRHTRCQNYRHGAMNKTRITATTTTITMTIALEHQMPKPFEISPFKNKIGLHPRCLVRDLCMS